MKRIFYSILLIIIALGSTHGQPINEKADGLTGTWKCEITYKQMGPFTTFMEYHVSDDTSFSANSPKNADKRMFGFFKAMLARLFNKSPKKGILIKMRNGNITHYEDTDSLHGKIWIPMLGTNKFSAVKNSDGITGKIKDSTSVIGTYTATRNPSHSKINFDPLAEKIIDTTGKYIFNPQKLKTRSWKRFERKLRKLSTKAVDDVEFFFGSYRLINKLPFSHYRLFLFRNEPGMTSSDNLSLEELNEKSALLNIKSFGGSAAEMDSVFSIIMSKNYENLVVDLRNNSGGGLNSAIPFGQHLTSKKLDAGVFLTHQWFNKHTDPPSEKMYVKIPATQSTTTRDFTKELMHNAARRLVIHPGNQTYQGNLFVLTDHNTASTCEPIVYMLKHNNMATIVGKKTAGAMLSAVPLKITDKYYLFMPIADYYTNDGVRLEQRGVKPDINVESQNDLEYVRENFLK